MNYSFSSDMFIGEQPSLPTFQNPLQGFSYPCEPVPRYSYAAVSSFSTPQKLQGDSCCYSFNLSQMDYSTLSENQTYEQIPFNQFSVFPEAPKILPIFSWDSEPTEVGSFSDLPQKLQSPSSVDDFFQFNEEGSLSSPLKQDVDYFDCQKELPTEETDSDSTPGTPSTLPMSPEKTCTAATSPRVNKDDLKGWCEEDEQLLKKLVFQLKFDWKKIAKKFGNKKYTPHFLKKKFKGYSEGPIPKGVKFTHEEDLLIAKCFDEYGVDWEKMVAHFPNRTSVMIKNRYYSYIKKNNMLANLLQEAGISEQSSNSESVQSEVESRCSHEEIQESPNLWKEPNVEHNNDENSMLRAQLKSLKTLYIVTYKELTKLRRS